MSKLILIADDEEKNLFLLKELLSGWGYTTIEARNGFEAITAARSRKPDLVLMDVMMPGKGGYTASAEINSNPSNGSIPIIIVTGLDKSLKKSLDAELGVVGYITKPIYPEKLKTLIEKYI